jgi:predicted RNase H-like HicB family nuclease
MMRPLGAMSQGQTLAELEQNIRDSYHLMMEVEIAPGDAAVQMSLIEV